MRGPGRSGAHGRRRSGATRGTGEAAYARTREERHAEPCGADRGGFGRRQVRPSAVAHGGPGLTALAPVRRRFPRWPGLSAPDHVALTFDDASDPRFTPGFLAALDARRVRATFFLLGPMVQAAPGLAAEIAAAGHEIGVHGWDHRYATVRGPRALHDDLARARDTIAAATGTAPAHSTGRHVRGTSAAAGAPYRRPSSLPGCGRSCGLPGDGSGSRGPHRVMCRRPWPVPCVAGRRCSCTIRTRTTPPACKAAAASWARCPGCWMTVAAAACGWARSLGTQRTAPARTTAASGEVKAAVRGK